MKKIQEMSESEIRETIEQLEQVDTKSVKPVIKELWDEITKRKKEAEEAKRREEETKFAKKREEELTLAEKQKDVIGKFFEIDGKYYKAEGVLGDNVLLSIRKCIKVAGKTQDYKGGLVKNVDDVLKCKEVSSKEYYNQKIDFTKNIADNLDSFSETMNAFLDGMDDFEKLSEKIFGRTFHLF